MPSQPHIPAPDKNGFHRLRLYLQIVARLRRRRKIALLIGIDYINGGSFELNGSRKDIEALEQLLIDLRFDKVIVLSDREGTPESMVPTKANILRELGALVSSHPHADFFFAYSGHCCQRPDYTGEEDDGMEECIIPCDAVDLSTASEDPDDAILDSFVIPDKARIYDPLKFKSEKRSDHRPIPQTLNRFLVQGLPPGSQLIALFESCHSGTLLNLRHRQCNRVEGYRSKIQDGFRRVYEPIHYQLTRTKIHLYTTGNRARMESTHSLLPKQETAPRKSRKETCTGFCPRLPFYEKQVICFSSCDDSQMTMDSHDGGAMIQSFVQFIQTNKRPKYKQIMKAINEGVRNHRQDRRRQMDDYLVANKKCDVTCSVLKHRWCLDSNERFHTEQIGAKCEPQLSSLRPLNTNSILKL